MRSKLQARKQSRQHWQALTLTVGGRIVLVIVLVLVLVLIVVHKAREKVASEQRHHHFDTAQRSARQRRRAPPIPELHRDAEALAQHAPFQRQCAGTLSLCDFLYFSILTMVTSLLAVLIASCTITSASAQALNISAEEAAQLVRDEFRYAYESYD